MLRTESHDNAFLERKLTASQLLARFAGVRGPDLRDPASVHKRRPLASWGLPTHTRWRNARRGLTRSQPAGVQAIGPPKLAIGVTTAWSANSPPAQLGA
jgi:hypothetical protein